jgi:WD40 repeat protein
VWALVGCARGKLASGSCDSTIKIWDVATGQCERTLQDHNSCMGALAACAGGKLASGSDDKTIKVWGQGS